jgi:hypothetical protein
MLNASQCYAGIAKMSSAAVDLINDEPLKFAEKFRRQARFLRSILSRVNDKPSLDIAITAFHGAFLFFVSIDRASRNERGEWDAHVAPSPLPDQYQPA